MAVDGIRKEKKLFKEVTMKKKVEKHWASLRQLGLFP